MHNHSILRNNSKLEQKSRLMEKLGNSNTNFDWIKIDNINKRLEQFLWEEAHLGLVLETN